MQHPIRHAEPTNTTTSSPVVTQQALTGIDRVTLYGTGKRMWASPLNTYCVWVRLLSARVLELGFIVTTCARQCKCTCLQGAPLSEVELSSFVLWHRKNLYFDRVCFKIFENFKIIYEPHPRDQRANTTKCSVVCLWFLVLVYEPMQSVS